MRPGATAKRIRQEAALERWEARASDPQVSELHRAHAVVEIQNLRAAMDRPRKRTTVAGFEIQP